MRILVPVLLSFACLAVASPASAQVDDADCALCHDDIQAAFVQSGTGKAPGGHAKADCQSCHGPGEAHIEEGGDLEKIVRFGTLSAKESSSRCLACHQEQEIHFSARQGIHHLSDVSCTDCHDPHSGAQTMLRETGAALCSSCHPGVAARFGMPRSHPMAENGPGCVQCHQPHGANRQLQRDGLHGTCGNCHFEKTGPFFYGHDTSLIDGCGSCHEVHGSTGRHLLVHENQVNLCYQCHTAAVTPGWHSASRFLDEKCTACHTAIHGSNTSQFFLEE
jgi:DmsE family decaheme c-type cytochrome